MAGRYNREVTKAAIRLAITDRRDRHPKSRAADESDPEAPLAKGRHVGVHARQRAFERGISQIEDGLCKVM